MMLGLLRSFDPRPSLTMGLAALLSWTNTLIPFLVPAIVLAVGGDRRGSPTIWEGTPGGALIGIPLFIGGFFIADRIRGVVAVPTRSGVLALRARIP